MGNKFKLDYEGKDSIKEEVESIRDSYLEKSKSQIELEKLRRIDSKVKNIPLIISLFFGIAGTLLFGYGMAQFLSIKDNYILGGISAGIGIIFIAIAYPLYSMIYKHLKNKYKDQIFELSEKILNDNEF